MKLTGRRETADQQDILVLERRFAAGIAAVWAAVTDPAHLQRWIGTWSGDPASGSVVFRMTSEGDDVPDQIWDIERCDPPRRLDVRTREATPFSEDGSGERVHWVLRLELVETAGETMLTFVQALADGPLGTDMAASVGPGWEYYLDRLVAAMSGADVADLEWAAYEPMSAAYRELFSC